MCLLSTLRRGQCPLKLAASALLTPPLSCLDIPAGGVLFAPLRLLALRERVRLCLAAGFPAAYAFIDKYPTSELSGALSQQFVMPLTQEFRACLVNAGVVSDVVDFLD